MTPREDLEVALMLDRDVYAIGEPVRPRLRIGNTGEAPITIRGFRFDDEALAFSPPSAAHLVGPGGHDHLLPYAVRGPGAAVGHPLVVPPGDEEWAFLPLSTFAALREPGDYAFWIELLDDRGQIARSNRLPFRLVDLDAAAATPPVELSLSAARTTFAAGEPIDVEAVFTNRSPASLILLQPQEDSLWGWVNPVYRFTVVERDGRILPPALRTGTMATPAYDATTRFAVPPGASGQQPLRLPDFPGLRTPSEYRVMLTYIVRDRAIGKGGVVLETPMRWPEGTFVGRLESGELAITIR